MRFKCLKTFLYSNKSLYRIQHYRSIITATPITHVPITSSYQLAQYLTTHHLTLNIYSFQCIDSLSFSKYICEKKKNHPVILIFTEGSTASLCSRYVMSYFNENQIIFENKNKHNRDFPQEGIHIHTFPTSKCIVDPLIDNLDNVQDPHDSQLQRSQPQTISVYLIPVDNSPFCVTHYQLSSIPAIKLLFSNYINLVQHFQWKIGQYDDLSINTFDKQVTLLVQHCHALLTEPSVKFYMSHPQVKTSIPKVTLFSNIFLIINRIKHILSENLVLQINPFQVNQQKIIQIMSYLDQLPKCTEWNSHFNPFITDIQLQLHLICWNLHCPIVLYPQLGTPSILFNQINIALNQCRQYLKHDNFSLLISNCQIALFDVKNISLSDIMDGIQVLQNLENGIEVEKNVILLNAYKNRIREYRKKYPEPIIETSNIPNELLHTDTQYLYSNAMGTMAPKFLIKGYKKKKKNFLSTKHINCASRLYRMAAAKIWMQSLHVTPDTLLKTNLQKQAIEYAMEAHYLQQQAQEALPNLWNSRLMPPSTRLLSAIIGSLKHHRKLQDTIVSNTLATITPYRLPNVAAYVNKRLIGRSRGGRPRKDQGKKRYVWLGPHWKPPWAPKRTWKPEEWGWKF